MDILIDLYLVGIILTALLTGFLMLIMIDFEEIDNVWDWMIYSIFWIKQPIKALIKLLFKNWGINIGRNNFFNFKERNIWDEGWPCSPRKFIITQIVISIIVVILIILYNIS